MGRRRTILLVVSVITLTFALTLPLTQGQAPDPSSLVNAGELGRVQGFTGTTLGKRQRSYFKYLGIPYAKKAVRFRPSELHEGPIEPGSSDPFNATQFGSPCPQPNGSGSEDCLYLNVFTPTVNATAKLPVLVFIHGAAFVSGDSNMYDGGRLLERELVIVAFNYRLGVFGYYNLEMPSMESPGNAALYDALTVLRWVQKFIGHWGGDPGKVTLAGQSSGAATVSHLLLSPLTTGLFHRLIAASGSALDVWATSANPLTASLTVAGYVGCHDPMTQPWQLNKTQVLNCMLSRNQTTLSNAQNRFQGEDMYGGGIGFAHTNPSVQTFLPPSVAIVPYNPKVTLESGSQHNVPIMMGVTRDDGGFALRLTVDGYILPHRLLNDTNWMRTGLVPRIFGAVGISDPTNTVANAVSGIYLVEEDRESGNFSRMVPSLFDLLGVLFFKSNSHRTVQLHSKIQADSYYYSFEYEGRFTRHPTNVIFPGGVAHADDLMYLFQASPALNEEELLLSEAMVDYWANFMTTGNSNTFPDGIDSPPSHTHWPSLSVGIASSQGSYLKLDKDIEAMGDYPGSWVIANRRSPQSPIATTTSPDTTTCSSSPPLFNAVSILSSVFIALMASSLAQ